MKNQSITTLIRSSFCCLLAVTGTFISLAQKPAAENIVYFDLNVAKLSADATKTIDALVSTNKVNKSQQLLLYGYADYLGSRAHNDSLSTERAMNVRSYLMKKGIPEKNVTVCVGKGQIERAPKAGHTGYAEDRKVEIITDAGKIKKLACRPLTKYEPLGWSKNVNKLNVHAPQEKSTREITDKTITVRLPNGDKYIGEINAQGEKLSNGVYMFKNGDKYQGDFKNDQRDGRGVYTWENGDVLNGIWQNNEIVEGKLTIPYNGPLYHSDENHTHSDVAYKGDLVYSGQFQNHSLSGHGQAMWPNGDVYNGEWKNDKMNGHGIYTWPTQQKYNGEWKDNKMNGNGQVLAPNGVILQAGKWENDVYKGQ